MDGSATLTIDASTKSTKAIAQSSASVSLPRRVERKVGAVVAVKSAVAVAMKEHLGMLGGHFDDGSRQRNVTGSRTTRWARPAPGNPVDVHLVIDEWLPATEQAPTMARRLIERLPGSAPLRPGMDLVVSELVTNAVRHGAAKGAKRVRFRAETVPKWTRIDVCDSGPGFIDSFPARTEPG